MEDLRYVNIDSYDSLDYFVNDVLDLLDKYDSYKKNYDKIISYGLCDFISMLLSIFIIDRKNIINNTLHGDERNINA